MFSPFLSSPPHQMDGLGGTGLIRRHAHTPRGAGHYWTPSRTTHRMSFCTCRLQGLAAASLSLSGLTGLRCVRRYWHCWKSANFRLCEREDAYQLGVLKSWSSTAGDGMRDDWLHSHGAINDVKTPGQHIILKVYKVGKTLNVFWINRKPLHIQDSIHDSITSRTNRPYLHRSKAMMRWQ